MELIIGKTAGFCFGVKNAVTKTKEALEMDKNICCLGELVHNKQVTNELEEKGIKFIDDISNANKKIIIRAHGEPKKTYKKAQELDLEIIDLTCPKVLKIHNIAEEFSKENYYIFLIGAKKHPEIIGTISYCGENSSIIEDECDVEKAIEEFRNSKLEKLLIISQTTFSLEKFKEIKLKIYSLIDKENVKVEVKNTICSATKLRQEETCEISKKVDYMIIIGGKHSSNTTKLYEVASKNCKNCVLIESEEELNINDIKKIKTIGIMAGASTSEKSINSVVEMLNKI